MPIRFRCAYCNQLMGIARRKAGTVVRCPTCGGQVVVPHPNQEPAPQAMQKAGGLFENTDFDKLLREPSPSSKGSGPPPPPPPGAGGKVPRVDVEPFPLTGNLQPGGGPSMGKILLMTVVLCVLLGLAFLAGFLVGRSSLE
jgi:hypothetical protein